MKKIIILFSMFFISTGFVFAQSFGGRDSGNTTGICYMMSSYSQSANSANTPLFNIQIFNQPCFYIQYTSFTNGFQFLFDLIIGASIATAIILFTVGAAQSIIGEATGKNKAEGKARMQNSIIGLMIILSMWLVINTINPDLLRIPMFGKIEKLDDKGSSSGGTSSVTASSS